MDIISHGFYGGVAFVNKSKRSFWTAFFWGVFPDLFAFGVFFPMFFFRHGLFNPDIKYAEPPVLPDIPGYINFLYSLSHSLVIFGLVLFALYIWKGRIILEMLPWGLHILMDIPSHTSAFFPTPFIYPLSSFHVNGISWITPAFFVSYWAILAALYASQLTRRLRRKRTVRRH